MLSSQIALAMIDLCAHRRAGVTRTRPAFLLAIMQQTNRRYVQSKGRVSQRGNKWTESLSRPMFLSPITWLHDVAGTFMDSLIQCWWIKTKLRWTGLNLVCDEPHAIPTARKNKHFINNKTLLYFIFSGWFNHFSQHFFLECLLPVCENGVCIDELSPILISHHSWCGHFLVYYTTVAAYSPCSRKVDIWTTWPWQYGDNEISLMTLPERF